MATRDEIVRVCDEYCAAVTARDVERILRLFAPDARQYEPIGTEPNVGHEAIGAFFTRNPHVSLTVTRLGPVTVAGNHAAMQIRVAADRGEGVQLMTSTDMVELDTAGLITSITAIPDRAAAPDDRGPVR